MEFPAAAPTIASELRAAGYATFAVGKWHLAREIEQSAAGSRHGWPLQKGFDRFYGFLDGFTNFFHPHQLVSDNHHLPIDEFPSGYYLTDDLTKQACAMIREHRAADSRKPFFLYLAHGAVHAPLQAPAADIDPFEGRYDVGWDEIRLRRFERQKEIGLFPSDSTMPDPNVDADFEFPAWGDLSMEQQHLAGRYMEVYAAMVATVDRSMASLRHTLEALGEWEDTIVMFMSDNGASSDLGPNGTTRYMLGHGSPIPEDRGLDMQNRDAIGGPRVFAHYPRGWALACNTPFRLYKRNTHAGGHTVPFIVHWPRAGLPGGEIRDGYAHVVDLLPTILDLADVGDGPSDLIDGSSFAASITDPRIGPVRREQLYEAHGNRGLYSDGWEIVAEHQPLRPFTEGDWELYRVETDVTEMEDLSTHHPERVRELSKRWDDLAARGDVFPLEDGSGVFFHQRPAFHRPSEAATFWPGLPTIERIRARDLIWNRSFTVTAYLGDDVAPRRGVIVAHGDQATGYQIHVESDELVVAINAGGVMTEISAGPVSPDASIVGLDVSCPVIDRWDVDVRVDGEVRAHRGDVWMRTGLMTPLHGIDIGLCRGSPVSWDIYERHGTFPWVGKIDKVVYQPGAFAADAPQLRVGEFREIGLAVPGGKRPIPESPDRRD